MTIRIGQPQADRVSEFFSGKSQSQTLHALSHRRLYRHFAIAHAPGDGFWAGPEGRMKSTLASQRIDHATLSRFRQ
ncbi:hypothetical protein D3C76_623350 [compost metagenome]